ncbi:MAG: Zn-ribbon domain-containing OB-fold protein [Deltaproteobacteria bacterium]|nr:Zn-ribbon domain-containing OB-fold protein [Deltaproteobacteria bacterium]
MSEAAAAQSKPLPVVSFLKIPDQGKPYLEGQRCKGCKAVFLGARDVCASCGARNQFEQIKLADKGELYVYSITYRSFPGIETPYISAVVDLEGGGTVKGNLIGIDADPKKIRMGMSVEVVYKIAPRKDREGNEYLTYYFQPAKA